MLIHLTGNRMGYSSSSLKIPHHAPGRLFEGVACPSALGRDPTRAKNQNGQLRNRVSSLATRHLKKN
jgi:hypothetical protein